MTKPQAAHPFAHTGGTMAMIGTALVNLLFSVLTLSLWRFWGRTRVRRALWSGTSAWGDPLEYTGTGKELFKGFLIVLFAIYLPLAAGFGWAQTLAAAGDPRGPLVMAGLYLLTILLIAAGLYRARRYQMSRTLWRGIRGGQTGSALSYAARSLLVWVLVPLSLGWAWPWGEMWLARYRLGHTTFGDKPIRCDATAGELYGRFALVWVSALLYGGVMAVLLGLTATASAVLPGWLGGDEAEAVLAGVMLLGLPVAMVTMALPWAWYRAGFYRRLAAGTSFEGATFSAEIGAWAMLRLGLGNMVISLFSLGILRPWTALRTFRAGCRLIAVDGVPDFDAIHQGRDLGPGMGEGLISVLDGAGEF